MEQFSGASEIEHWEHTFGTMTLADVAADPRYWGGGGNALPADAIAESPGAGAATAPAAAVSQGPGADAPIEPTKLGDPAPVIEPPVIVHGEPPNVPTGAAAPDPSAP